MDFAKAASLVPYLAKLGVSHLYASPISTARAGSTHGYDVVDYNSVDPVLGGEEGLLKLSRALARHRMGLLLDIVPNHMGLGPENFWWWDVLKCGRASEHAAVFDIDWTGGIAGAEGRICVPILGDSLEQTLAAGKIQVVRGGRDPFEVAYCDHRFPLSSETSGLLRNGKGTALSRVNEAPYAQLRELLDRQHYRLAHWRRAATALNWRRFFDINDLIGVRVEDPEVFAKTHKLVLRLIGQGILHGLRIDHIDGLADPKTYLSRLAAAAREAGATRSFILLVEKILAPGETLPTDWETHGTTGYEVLNEIGGLFVDPKANAPLTRFYRKFTGATATFTRLVADAKTEILDHTFGGERSRLARLAVRAAPVPTLGKNGDIALAESAVTAVLQEMPVYRTYLDGEQPSVHDSAILERIRTRTARRMNGGGRRAVASVLGILQRPTGHRRQNFSRRLQQLSGALMAKAVEDTAFYRDARFILRNEVGTTPRQWSVSPLQAHQRAQLRLARHPRTLVPLATHDTKRGADVRARLAALSEFPAEWASAVRRWSALTRRHATRGPDRISEYLLYETLVAAWPPDLAPVRGAPLAEFTERIQAYMLKAAREAKTHTSWSEPRREYEHGLSLFVASALDPEKCGAFLRDLARFVRRLAVAGASISIAQCVIQATTPGIADIYQGSEDWHWRLVDPDNRRPPDFAALEAGLDNPAEAGPGDARWKLQILSRVLRLRSMDPELFSAGEYRPLRAEGAHAPQVFAYARILEQRFAIVLAARLIGNALGRGKHVPSTDTWADTQLLLPEPLRCAVLRDVVSGKNVRCAGGRLRLSEVLRTHPAAVLVAFNEKTESAMASRRQKSKVKRVMHEYKHGTLKSGSGGKVKSRKQAVAIAMSESGQSRKGKGTKRKGK
jgi:(1->4)-alpha-D-glucan 1-alpha-D-glucosylmutase